MMEDSPSSLRRLHDRLIVNIAGQCDTTTQAILCGLSKSLHMPFQEALYRCIAIRNSDQLDTFARLVTMESEHDGKKDICLGPRSYHSV